ncbi:MAG: amidophosphoribosyltransferase [Opitutales bacterium]|nr:amidophosphoribosyltransferase [Opitutales bacterium]
MSDPIKHECGIAMIRLLKPLDYYLDKYGSALWGFNKLFLLMEKQHNRGQDGAGVAVMKQDMPPGEPYIFRERSIKADSLNRIFRKLSKDLDRQIKKGRVYPEFPATLKKYFDFSGEAMLGHLRYGTFGGYSLRSCHPYYRKSNWPGKNLVLAGNFNLTNTPELNQALIQMGQHPIFESDTQTLLEKIGYYLDREHDRMFEIIAGEEKDPRVVAARIAAELDIGEVVQKASRSWDGGYALVGMVGTGDAFAFRDPQGIRPCHYLHNEEVFAVASERAPLMTAFDVYQEEVQEVEPGTVMRLAKSGELHKTVFATSDQRSSCSFERIYFSRGNDPDIYQERKALGGSLAARLIKAAGGDFRKAVFGFIPNTAETAYYGLMDELRRIRREQVKQGILKASQNGNLDEETLDNLIMEGWPRGEKVAIKDIKLRTFISQESGRNDLVSHVYDISYGTVGPDDALVCIDDSIVRGTTLKRSILKILSRFHPRKIIIASTAPQIRYPDCYGIDMSELGKFIAFEAAIDLWRERGNEAFLGEVYQRCIAEVKKPLGEMRNCVQDIYEPFTAEELSARITQLVKPRLDHWDGEVELIFQDIKSLHRSLPKHRGDWYFTGNYPTPGGYKVVNNAYINFYEKQSGRSY